jgi:hypothetical protein
MLFASDSASNLRLANFRSLIFLLFFYGVQKHLRGIRVASVSQTNFFKRNLRSKHENN